MSKIQFTKAVRTTTKIKMAILGPSGSGKTYSALKIASGLGQKIALLDTEAGSSSLYSDHFDFDYIVLRPPFEPERYIEIIKEAVEAKYDVLIIDSLTHAWDGEGGSMDKKSQLDSRGGRQNEFTNWKPVKQEQKKLTEALNVLSGEGENQGKAFWSRSFQTDHGVEKWEFTEIPAKYKEFVESVIEFDKRALAVILAGKGLDPAISNVTNEGIFNSGSEIYYNYLLYLDTQRYAEEFVCRDINTQLWVNFPELERARVKGGFYRFAPERQENTSPQNRMEKQSK